MINFYDFAYATGLMLSSPYWMIVPKAHRKVLGALRTRMGDSEGTAQTSEPPCASIMIHAVSVGELNATPALIGALGAARPQLHFVISTTTHTGAQRGEELFAHDPRVTLIRFPLDFSSAVRRVLNTHRPSVVVLMELEVWPNFIAQCRQRDIPVLVINGRLTTSSFRGYRRLRLLTRGMFQSLAHVSRRTRPTQNVSSKSARRPIVSRSPER